MSDIIVCANKSLDRSIDIDVTVNKNQAQIATDLSVPVFITEDAPFRHGAERIQFYTAFTTMQAIWTSSQEAYRAGNTFFGQKQKPRTFAVGCIFSTAQKGYMKSKAVQETIATWAAVTDGSFELSVDSVSQDVTALTFAAVTDLDDVAAVISAGITGATVVHEGGIFVYTSDSTGATSTISALATVAPAVGTDVSGSGFLNGQDDQQDPTDDVIIIPGYTPTGNIQDELDYVEEAALCSGKFVYGYLLDRVFRDSSDQTDASVWAEARTANLELCLNSPLVLDPNSTSDIGYLLNQTQPIRTSSSYHDNAFYYPDVAIMAIKLSVNYSAENSVITTKFKELIGIPTAGVDDTDMAVLLDKRVNTYTAVGNNAKTFREGQQANASWFNDELVNLDNYKEELETEVHNVFLQTNVVPYTAAGVALQRSAITLVSNRYVFNGSFSEREVLVEDSQFSSTGIEPPFIISHTPLSQMTVSDRAIRKGPPFTVNVNLSGAIHSTEITVNAYA